MASPLAFPPRVLEQTQISPPPGTATTSLPLTHYDVNWLYFHPGERVIMYALPHPTSDFLAHHLPALKSSLSLSLRRFFPFAGRVHPSPDGRTLEIRCVQGQDSVPFTVAESDDDFHQLCVDYPRHSTRLAALVPGLPGNDQSGTVPLLAVQVTVFPASGGLSIGFSYHHVVSDGTSFMHFVKTWAAENKLDGTPLPPPPYFDRSSVADPDSDNAMPPPPHPPAPTPAADTNIVFASFTLGRDDIARLKRKALARAQTLAEAPPFHCSAFVVTLAHAWVCLFKTQGRAGERAHAAFPVDCRERLSPPLPKEYFGNCLFPLFAQISMSDLLGEDGFSAAAEAIGRAIEGLAAEVRLTRRVDLADVLSVARERPVAVAGSPRTGVYSVDFGWGKPLKVDLLSIGGSTMSLAESRDGLGGIEIGLAMPDREIDKFGTLFHDGLHELLRL